MDDFVMILVFSVIILTIPLLAFFRRVNEKLGKWIVVIIVALIAYLAWRYGW